MGDLLTLQATLSRGIQEGAAPGAALCFAAREVGADGAVTWRGAELFEGRVSVETQADFVSRETIYDLASLTKPLACAWWAWRLWSAGRLNLNLSIGEALAPSGVHMSDPAVASAPVWRLLNHSSGLPAHRPYYEGLAGERMRGDDPLSFKRWVRRVITRTPAEYPPGAQGLYSDLGFLLLEWLCELYAGETLEEMWAREAPVEGLHFNPLTHPTSSPLTHPTSHYAPTEACGWRERTLRGEVHDDNAWLCGGVCGHAGLFGRAADVAAWGMWLVEALKGQESALALSQTTLSHVVNPRRRPQGGSFVLGLDTPSEGYTSAGAHLSRVNSVGHLGFTGTSLWVDYERGLVVALLTNRVHPTRDKGLKALRWLRPAVCDAVWRVFG